MRRIFTILLGIFVVVNVWAQQYAVVDGIRYGYAADTAFVARGETDDFYTGDVVIPSQVTIDEISYPVTAIGDSAFYMSNNSSIIIPESVTSIGKYAFYYCKIKSINLLNTIVHIDIYAFSGASLTSITIPNSVTKILEGTFCGCFSLTSVTLSSNLKVIDKEAFYYCSSLTQFTIPNSVTFIGMKAFSETGLTSIKIPKSVTKIETPAFPGCKSLTTITVDSENPVYDSRNNCNAIIETQSNYLVCGCKNTTIPNSIVTIGEFAFIYCTFKSISIPNSVTKIGDDAFYGTSLTSLTIPNSVTQIGSGAFTSTKLSTVTIPNSVTQIGSGAFSQINTLTSVELPNSITEIEDYMFYFCLNLQSIRIPKTITSVGASVFKDCRGLQTIDIPENVTSIGTEAFYNCYSLTEITIPNKVTVINKSTFSNCTSLTSIIFSDGITTINEFAFSNCSSLTAISIPDGVTSIGRSAFNECSGLTSIKFPKNLSTIEMWCFLDCVNLKSIIIQSSAISIKSETFKGCENLSEIICYSPIPPNITSYTFPLYEAVLYVPCESIDLYIEHEIWGLFSEIKCIFEVFDIPDISVNDGVELPIVDLSIYYKSLGLPFFSVQSSNNQIVYPILMGDKLGLIQFGTGTTTIEISALEGENRVKKHFDVTIAVSTPSQPCELSISSEITNATCNGMTNGKIEVSVSGGTEPYYYKWNTGRTSNGVYNVGAGEYSVLVFDDNGCTAMESFIVTEPLAIQVSEITTHPTCNENDGRIEINVSGGVAPYSYVWSFSDEITEATQNIENLSADVYTVTVTDENNCQVVKNISLSDKDAPTITLKEVKPSKCNDTTGSVIVSVSPRGVLNFDTYEWVENKYEWSDSSKVSNIFKRTRLYSGDYKFTVTNLDNCHSVLSVNVPLTSVRQPEIALVSYGDTARHNLVVWQKEQTDDIDEYHIYRETEQSGVYEQIGSSAYNEASIYVDSTADFNSQSFRYRLSAANSCGETPLSREYKTIQLRWKKNDNGSVQLWWDSYEGLAFVKYDLYKLSRNGLEKFQELPANKFKYTVDVVEPGTIGYFVAVELIDTIDVKQYLKAEAGPFATAWSNIAEIENRDAIEVLKENQAVVYSKDKKIIIVNAQNKNIFVCDVTGKLVAQRQNVDSAEIPVQTVGMYVVIVGKNVFKVIVN